MKPHTILCIMISMLPVIGIGNTQSGPENILEKSFQVGAGGTLVLDAAIGTVDVRTAKTSVVTVKVSPQLKTDIAADRQRLLANILVDTTQQKNDVTITAKFRRETPDDERRKIGLHFEISVPHDYNVELNTVGAVRASDLHGNVKIHTAGGSISLGNIDGDVVAASSGGKINVAGVNGGLTVDSSGGSLTAGRVSGSIKVATEGGPISFAEVADSIQAETGGGSFTAYLSRQPHSDSSISTAGGRIDMSLAQGLGVNLEANTANGRVITDDPSLTAPNSKLNVLRASLNGGGPRLVLRAAAGTIHVRTSAKKDSQQ